MNNLSQAKETAKNAYLDSQRSRVLAQYENVSINEQLAVIKNIDSFLPTLTGEAKIFWLKLRENLERLTERRQAESEVKQNA